MKKYLLLSILSLGISSCCTKKACVEMSTIPISFYGFTAADVDTIYTTGYAIGSGFTTVTRPEELDTVMNKGNIADNVYILRSRNGNDELSDAYEWSVYIPSVNKTIHINGYGYNSYSCNNCPFDKGDNVHTLSTCSVDGVITNVNQVQVNK